MDKNKNKISLYLFLEPKNNFLLECIKIKHNLTSKGEVINFILEDYSKREDIKHILEAMK